MMVRVCQAISLRKRSSDQYRQLLSQLRAPSIQLTTRSGLTDVLGVCHICECKIDASNQGPRFGPGFYYTRKDRLVNVNYADVITVRIYLLLIYYRTGYISESIKTLIEDGPTIETA